MIRFVIPTIIMILICGSEVFAAGPPETAPSNWKLTFSDEFDQLDLSRWNTKFPLGNRFLGGQGEREMYVDLTYTGNTSISLGLNPFLIKDSILTICADRATSAIRQHLAGQSFTSGLLTSEHSHSQLYGYFEIRAKFPIGKGLWPGFWLLPADRSWPPEIDIVELRGDQPTTLYTSVHMRGPGQQHIYTTLRPTVSDVTANFHVYGLIWSPTYLAWYVDNKRVSYTTTPPDVNKPMFLLIQLAVGGSLPGQPDESTKFPASMEIDYVRTYALPSL